jgi:hypothetical protein
MSEGDISFLGELQKPDEMALVFNPIGFGGQMEPEDAARFQAEAIADATLVEAVPTEIVENFERARKLHLYGVLEYEFFTVASDQALLVLESALRVRLLSYYSGGIPVTREGVEETLHAESFEDVRRARGTLKLLGREGATPLPVGARALLGWARGERLLPGSSTRRVDHALGELRNYAAHQEGRAVHGPPDSARTVRDVAEVINTLWGCRVPGGRLFPAPVARVPRVASIAHGGRGAAEMGLHHVLDLDPSEQDSDFGVFLAAVDEKLTERRGDDWAFTHRPGLQWTIYPCDQIWTGDHAGLVRAIESGSFTDLGDRVEHLDRLFFVRRRDGQTDEPRGAADLLALDQLPAGRWHAVLADDPHQAFMHVRDHTGRGLSERRGGCPACFARTRGVFSNPGEVLALARAELVETRPRVAES